MIEMIVQPLGLLFKRFDVSIDIVFFSSAIHAAFVQRLLEAVPKSVGLALDAIKEPRDFLVTEAIRLTHNLTPGMARHRGQRQYETASN